jgi:hypothetical protein
MKRAAPTAAAAKADRQSTRMFTFLFDAGPGGLPGAEWNARKIEWDRSARDWAALASWPDGG